MTNHSASVVTRYGYELAPEWEVNGEAFTGHYDHYSCPHYSPYEVKDSDDDLLNVEHMFVHSVLYAAITYCQRGECIQEKLRIVNSYLEGLKCKPDEIEVFRSKFVE